MKPLKKCCRNSFVKGFQAHQNTLMLNTMLYLERAVGLTLHDMPLSQAGRGWGELGLIVLHYAWTFAMAFACLAPLQAVVYLLLAQARSHPALPG